MSKVFVPVLVVMLFLSSFSVFTPAARSAEAPAVEWYRAFGGIGDESMFLGSRSVIETSDGGYALVGRTMSVSPSAVLFVKTDAAGNMQWNRTYGRQQQPNGDLASSVIQTNDGGYALAGASWNQARGAHGLFLVKTDSSGNMQWNLTYIRDTSGGYLDWGHAFSVIQTNDGGYMVGAGVRHHPDHSTGDWDGWLVKTDAIGTVQWDKPYGGSSDEGVHEVLQASDGGYIFVGTTLSYGVGSGEVWLVKTDGSGNQQWARTFGGSNWDDGNSIAKTSDGGYIIGAATSSFGAGSWDFWLVKTDVNGNQQWTETFGGANEDIAWSVIETINGGYALAGSTKSLGAGDSDFWMVKTDSVGNQEWNTTFGGANYDDARSIVQTVDKGYAVAGYTNSFGAGSYDFLLVKLAGTAPRTWVVDDDGPADFSTIQEAINAASDGDTIFVKNRTYYEHVMVNKTLTLTGEDRNATIIDGEYKDPPEMQGSVMIVAADNVVISGFTIQHCREGGNAICITNYVNMTFSYNIITGCNEGVRMINSSGNVVSYNIVKDCYYNTGIGIDYGSNNTVHRNTIINSHYGISGGIDCHGNTFSENAIINNDIGFGTTSYDNKFFHNNFVNNDVHVIASGINQFDDGYPSGGNYWSEYDSWDVYCGVYQNETGSDGIGDDNPYTIDTDNQDNYPLIKPWIPYENGTTISIEYGVYPLAAPIGRNGRVFTFTEDIYGAIAINADDIILDGAGHTLQGCGSTRDGIGVGGNSGGCGNVTIKNVKIKGFTFGIFLGSLCDGTLSGNTISNNTCGIYLYGFLGSPIECSHDIISGNTIINNENGIVMDGAVIHNFVSDNIISNNSNCGIYLTTEYPGHSPCDENVVSGNLIANNGKGIFLNQAFDNLVYHNHFADNSAQIYSENAANTLDDGYPSGGNYWSDYTGEDLYLGEFQTEPGSDGMGDTPYFIDADNRDNYPLMNPWPSGWKLDFTAPTNHPIVDFAVYNGSLYAAADNKLYVKDENSWNVLAAPAFVTSLEPYGGKLVVGGQGGLFCYNGTSFGLIFSVSTYIKVLGVYDNRLYAGTMLDNPPTLYYCNGSADNPADWHVDTGFSAILNFSGAFGSIDSFAEYNGNGYVTSGGTVYCSNETGWSIAKTYDDVYAYLDMQAYNGKLYFATRDHGWRKPLYQGGTGFSGRVIEFDGENWTTVFDHDYWIYSLEVYDNKLYAGTANKIYTYNGTSWEVSFNATEGAYYAISTITYDGKIYVGMGNGYIFADPAPLKAEHETIVVPEFSSTTILAVFTARLQT